MPSALQGEKSKIHGSPALLKQLFDVLYGMDGSRTGWHGGKVMRARFPASSRADPPWLFKHLGQTEAKIVHVDHWAMFLIRHHALPAFPGERVGLDSKAGFGELHWRDKTVPISTLQSICGLQELMAEYFYLGSTSKAGT